jgi:alpha-tubulin suppressor-like RCC1 family protein
MPMALALMAVLALADPAAAAPLTGFTGQAVAAGGNANGQLGDGTHDAHRAPILVSALGSNVTQVAAGTGFGVALLADGTVWTWGRNDVGQLADGTVADSPIPRQVPNLPGITQISAGGQHVMALAADGTVWSWGGNLSGQVGVGYRVAVTSPVAVAGLSDFPVTQVSAGDAYSLAVGPNGNVVAWGDNYVGELGSGGANVSADYPVRVRDLSGVIQVAAGKQHALALRNDGSVWTWGAIGHLVYAVPQRVSELPQGVTQVAAGGGDSFAVTSDMQGVSVWAWGSNRDGRLGDNTPPSIGRRPSTSCCRTPSRSRHTPAARPW